MNKKISISAIIISMLASIIMYVVVFPFFVGVIDSIVTSNVFWFSSKCIVSVPSYLPGSSSLRFMYWLSIVNFPKGSSFPDLVVTLVFSISSTPYTLLK